MLLLHLRRAYHAVVVGSGPAGFYSAQELLSRAGATRVDLVERLPQPFGLVRTGIAPDHVNDKRVASEFAAVLADRARVRLFANVAVGDHGAPITLAQLRRDYPVVVLAHGSHRDRLLGVEGERSTGGVHSARAFAAWYNGIPDGSAPPFADELARATSVAIVGNGNVALDVARLLCKNRDELAATDMSRAALAALRGSSVRHVHIIGRRGIPHVSFTNRELREILKLEGCDVTVKLDAPLSAADVDAMNASRQGKRQLPLWRSAIDEPHRDPAHRYSITFHFLRSVAALRRDASGRLCGVDLATNRLDDRGAAVPTGEISTLADVQLLFRSIGFDAEPCSASLPVGRNGALVNDAGRVKDMPGVYVCGWLKRGPSGIVGTNKYDAEETAATIAADIGSGALTDLHRTPPRTCLDALQTPVVTNDGWFAIQAAEQARGQKITSAAEMIQLAGAAAAGSS
jgi:hypothetical protein